MDLQKSTAPFVDTSPTPSSSYSYSISLSISTNFTPSAAGGTSSFSYPNSAPTRIPSSSTPSVVSPVPPIPKTPNSSTIPPLLHVIYLKKITSNKYLMDLLSVLEKQLLITYAKQIEQYLPTSTSLSSPSATLAPSYDNSFSSSYPSPQSSSFPSSFAPQLTSEQFQHLMDLTKVIFQSFQKESPPLPSHSFILVVLMLLKSITPSSSLKYPCSELFFEHYSDFTTRNDKEKLFLYETANWMNVLFQFIPAKKNKGLVLDVIPKLIEGFDAVYTTGSGQTKQTADRVKIYELEGEIIPTKRCKWKTSDSPTNENEKSSPHRRVYKRRTVAKKESLSILVKKTTNSRGVNSPGSGAGAGTGIVGGVMPTITPIHGNILDKITGVNPLTFSSFPVTSPSLAMRSPYSGYSFMNSPTGPLGMQDYFMNMSSMANTATEESLIADLPDELPTVNSDQPRSETEVLYETYWSTDITDTTVAAVLSTVPTISSTSSSSSSSTSSSSSSSVVNISQTFSPSMTATLPSFSFTSTNLLTSPSSNNLTSGHGSPSSHWSISVENSLPDDHWHERVPFSEESDHRTHYF